MIQREYLRKHAFNLYPKACIQLKIVLNANKGRKNKSQLLKYSKNYIIPYHEVHECGREINNCTTF